MQLSALLILQQTLDLIRTLHTMCATLPNSSFNDASGSFACEEPGQVWLSTGWDLSNTMTFEISTPLLATRLVFVSGTAQSAVAAGFNMIYVDAETDPENPVRIRLGYGHGREAFLCVRQLNTADPPLLYSGPMTRDARHERCDEGVASMSAMFADLTCDGDVDGLDLAILLELWGGPAALADLDGSGMVDHGDLALMLGAWSPTPPPPWGFE